MTGDSVCIIFSIPQSPIPNSQSPIPNPQSPIPCQLFPNPLSTIPQYPWADYSPRYRLVMYL
ncbi:hypothetical protein [Nostoc sp. PCC 7524]|uniref:hypothetical protein n=1 Tax=Nostoc sp. (strain ATCC 29411 / PCC 7524) TaxID=28072 RepID=UPI000A308FEF|nr:hypothetical protein [Nostoc sp. PCC 7524]